MPTHTPAPCRYARELAPLVRLLLNAACRRHPREAFEGQGLSDDWPEQENQGCQLMTNKKTRLKIVVSLSDRASIIRPSTLPALRGNEPEDLVCGKCGSAIGEGVSTATVLKRVVVVADLVFVCPDCGSCNLVTN